MGAMMKTLSLILLLSLPALAGVVLFDGQEVAYDNDWSFKQYANRHSDIPDGTIVYASDFSQEDPSNFAFRSNMIGVHFYNCNLCGADVPAGNFVHDFNHNSGCGQ